MSEADEGKLMNKQLEGKRALIYGGGSGLGLACAAALLDAGASIFITGRRLERLKDARLQFAQPDRIGIAAGDFTNEADVSAVTDSAVAFLGGIDTLVVSSGVSAIGSVFTATPAQFDEVITTNLRGPFLAVRCAAPHLVRADAASVILISSIFGTVAMRERVAYCTSKAGVLGMARAMALDFAEDKVRVNAISPSLILTELAKDIMAREADPGAALARRQSQHPLGRLGEPYEIGAAAVYLASDDSAWITGQNLVIDGGLSIA